jgi:glycosyltransferase involved in cell wall biosynthesis
MTPTDPDVTVIVPAYNAATTITEQLEALRSQQTSFSFEVIVADNGSTDLTAKIVAGHMFDWPGLRLIDASTRRGSAHARNEGAKAALGAALAFCDADDVVEPQWLRHLVEPLTATRIVFGSLCVNAINDSDVARWRGAPHASTITSEDSTRSFAPSGNMAIFRPTYLELGGMDEDYPKSHDVEFSFRARAAGIELHPAPDAVVHYRYRSTLRGAFHQAFRGGRASAQMYSQYRDATAPRGVATVGRSYWWLVTRAPQLSRRDRRGLWVSALGGACGRVAGSVKYRLWYL